MSLLFFICFLFINKSFFIGDNFVFSFKLDIVSLTLNVLSLVFIVQYLLYFSFFIYSISFMANFSLISLSLNSKKLFFDNIFIASFIDCCMLISKSISFDIYVNTDNLSEIIFSF